MEKEKDKSTLVVERVMDGLTGELNENFTGKTTEETPIEEVVKHIRKYFISKLTEEDVFNDERVFSYICHCATETISRAVIESAFELAKRAKLEVVNDKMDSAISEDQQASN